MASAEGSGPELHMLMPLMNCSVAIGQYRKIFLDVCNELLELSAMSKLSTEDGHS